MDNFFENDNIKLYCGNSLELIDKIEDKSIDIILTDPPYWHKKSPRKAIF